MNTTFTSEEFEEILARVDKGIREADQDQLRYLVGEMLTFGMKISGDDPEAFFGLISLILCKICIARKHADVTRSTSEYKELIRLYTSGSGSLLLDAMRKSKDVEAFKTEVASRIDSIVPSINGQAEA